MSPYLPLALLVGLAISHTVAYLQGQRIERAQADADRIAAVSRAIEQANEQSRMDTEILSASARRSDAIQNNARIITRTVTRHVETPVYRECRIDACGLCLARAAARGDPGEDCPCGAADALLAPGGARRRDDGGAAGELR